MSKIMLKRMFEVSKAEIEELIANAFTDEFFTEHGIGDQDDMIALQTAICDCITFDTDGLPREIDVT